MDGFFVVLTLNKRTRQEDGSIMPFWKAELLETTSGWVPTKGKTPEAAMQLQIEQYHMRHEQKHPLPFLIKSTEEPMASGQMTRFVKVA